MSSSNNNPNEEQEDLMQHEEEQQGGGEAAGSSSSNQQQHPQDTTSSSSSTLHRPMPPLSSSASASGLLVGRVVRLHFRCHAELPMGAFLRVTGSTLWAPGTAAQDPADATPAVGSVHSQNAALVMHQHHGTTAALGDVEHEEAAAGGTGGSLAGLYASSVEMVTTPEEYPIWRTRRPVVVVIHNPKKTIQHHYYRYLVVCPGARHHDQEEGPEGSGGTDLGVTSAGVDDVDVEEGDGNVIVSTSNEFMGSTAVMQWEDPFGTLQKQTASSAFNSAVSLTSNSVWVGHTTKTDYRNLPYRTVDIDVKTATPVYDEAASNTSGSASIAKEPQDVPCRLDRWAAKDDVSFQPYLIREAIQQENRRKMQAFVSDVSADNANDFMETGAGHDNEGAQTPPAFPNNRIFFVCFHLPVVVVQSQSSGVWRASWSESILAKTEGSQILSQYQAYWVGTVTTHPPLQTEEDKEAVRAILQDMNCIPIFLDPVARQSHYYGFCKQVLWPAFHNIDLLDLSTCGWLSDHDSAASDWDQSRLDDWWNAYKQVNYDFAAAMSHLIKPGDILWIHDYHLSLLPQRLTVWEGQKYGRRISRKVFFLHIPFPTSQIFRELECGEEILGGMLHADVVGFHAFDHARHFLNAAKRILGLNYESLVGGLIGLSFQGSTVLVSMSNVSIEPRMVDAALMLPSVQTGKNQLKEKHKGRIIVAGLDIGQRLSGTALKLLAYERLLQDYPTWKPNVVMVQFVLLPGSRQADEDVTTRELRALVKRIQDKFGPDVIDYQEVSGTSLPMDQRLALWRATDILMTTPIREGLNHWPMEYIYAHKEPETPGVVIASEFSTISSILNGALRVNPYDIQMSATTIDKALSMSMQEREGRRYRDIDFVSSSPSDKWVKNVLRDLRDATMRNRTANHDNASSQASTPYSTPVPTHQEPVNTTAGFLAREAALAFTRLHNRGLKQAYDVARRRLIVLDFNGTIVLKEPPGKYLKREILGTSGNKPPPSVLSALAKLCQDPKNTVYVVSGDSVENVLNALGHIHGLGIAVSNGARFSPPIKPQDPSETGTQQQQRRRWLTFDLGVDWDAVKRVALPVLSKYTARSNGSFVKLTAFSIGWSYYSCDPEWGSLQAAHLVQELENELRAFDVRFVTLKGIVEIVPRKLNKGLVVHHILRELSIDQHPTDPVDFILCLGDDISDEKMFTSVFTFLAEMEDPSTMSTGPPLVDDAGNIVNHQLQQPHHQTVLQRQTQSLFKIPNPLYCYTVAVGKKPTHASFHVHDAQKVAHALITLAQPQHQQTAAGGGGGEDSEHSWGTGDPTTSAESQIFM